MKTKDIRRAGRSFVATIVLLSLGSFASADPIPASWSQSLDFDQTVPPAFTFSHDLTAVGFQPFAALITDFTLSLDIIDDSHRLLDGLEFVLVDLPGLLGDRVFFEVGGDEYGGVSLLGLLELNVLGTLTVTIDSIKVPRLFGDGYYGDFILRNSTLNARGYVSVPEPGTLALLGIGLIGMGLARRRKTA